MTRYNYEDIFSEIEDSEMVHMTIPQEICDAMGWSPGDIINIAVNEGTLTLKKHE